MECQVPTRTRPQRPLLFHGDVGLQHNASIQAGMQHLHVLPMEAGPCDHPWYRTLGDIAVVQLSRTHRSPMGSGGPPGEVKVTHATMHAGSYLQAPGVPREGADANEFGRAWNPPARGLRMQRPTHTWKASIMHGCKRLL